MLRHQLSVMIARSYLESAGWVEPNVVDCERYLSQEVGELSSALMKAGYQSREYRRNNPLDQEEARERVEAEIGDVALMLLSLANLLNIDLEAALNARLRHFHLKFIKQFDPDKLAAAHEAYYALDEATAMRQTIADVISQVSDALDLSDEQIDALRETFFSDL